MGVFHTIAMFCTMGALSLNNSSQNCHHLQTPHSSCWQSSSTFQLLCAISTTVFSRLSAESRNTSFSTAPKRTALEYSISSSILARPEAFSHSKIPTHLFPRATPPLISTDDQPTLPPTSPLPTPPLPASPPPILPSPSSTSQLQPPSANLPPPCRLSQQETSEHRLSSVSLRVPRHYKTRAVISNRYAIACSRSSNSGYRGADNPRHI